MKKNLNIYIMLYLNLTFTTQLKKKLYKKKQWIVVKGNNRKTKLIKYKINDLLVSF